jgi:hypothetical protein
MSRNGRGRPLPSHEVIEELAAVPLVRHAFHGEWNYITQPAAGKTPTAR